MLTKCRITINIKKKIRHLSEDNLNRLRELLNNEDWINVFSSNNVDESYDSFMNTLNNHFNNAIPLRENKKPKYKKNPKLPWISKSLLRSINRKNNLFYKFKAKPNAKTRKKYTCYKNVLTRLIRHEKKSYYSKQFDFYKTNIQKTWKVINDVLGKTKNRNPITKISFENTIVEDSKEMSEIFNTYFSKIGVELANNIPLTNTSFNDFLKSPNPNSLFLFPTNTSELIAIVNKLQDKKSTGYDDIDNILLKKIILYIAPPLVHIFNISFSSGSVPSNMKIAKIVPIHKKGDVKDVSNYRPISLLTSLSKVLEKLVYLRTVKFFLNHNIFSDFQFGFREKHSTVHAILTFIHKVASALDNHLHTIGIFLDLSKAFDTINHDILLQKLFYYGVRGNALEWFRNYLSNRKQFVFLNGESSSLQNLECGVPQGSLLGPLLFLIYINDIQYSSKILSFILFADDSNIFLSHSDPHVLLRILNTELKYVSHWMKANKLSLNLLKTKFMLFSNSISNLPGDIIFDDTILVKVNSIKFLGLTIDDNLSWKIHIDNVSKIISRNIGIIYRLKYFFPPSMLLMLYSTLILPYLNYGILAWGNTAKLLLDRIYLLQKKIVRIICNTNFYSHTNSLFHKNKLLKIYDIYDFNLGQFMYKYSKNELPNIFTNMFIKNSAIHKYPTRQSNSLHLPLTRTLFANRTFNFTGPKLWNSLDKSLKEPHSLYSFKQKFKKQLLDKYVN